MADRPPPTGEDLLAADRLMGSFVQHLGGRTQGAAMAATLEMHEMAGLSLEWHLAAVRIGDEKAAKVLEYIGAKEDTVIALSGAQLREILGGNSLLAMAIATLAALGITHPDQEEGKPGA